MVLSMVSRICSTCKPVDINAYQIKCMYYFVSLQIHIAIQMNIEIIAELITDSNDDVFQYSGSCMATTCQKSTIKLFMD
jgi:hypothetical protein